MTNAQDEAQFDAYAARKGRHWTPEQRADARRGYLEAIADGREIERKKAQATSESYALH